MAESDNVICNESTLDIYIYIYLFIYIFSSSHTQLTVHCKIDYMFRLVQAIIRPVTIILKRKIKIVVRSQISHLLAVLFFCVLVMGLVTAFSRRNMQPILHCVVSFV